MKKLLLTFVLGLYYFGAIGSHLMGGQITARNLGLLNYEITLTLYRDILGIPISPNTMIEFGDTNGVVFNSMTIYPPYQAPVSLGNGVEKYVYIDTVTFPFPGVFKAFYSECCRNSAILNMIDPGGKSLYLDARITVDPSNSTPEFLNDPITVAQDSVPFTYNPAPFDIDGDSLSWIMDIPQDNIPTPGTPILPYFLPPSDTSNPFALNPSTGEITFTPVAIGNFQISVKAIEYRNGQIIGYIRRDMQLIVLPSPNAPIVVNATPNVNRLSGNGAQTLSTPIQVQPGQHLSFLLEATNPDNGAIVVSVIGDAFIAATPALITSNAPYTSNGTVSTTSTIIDWYPTQAEVSNKPYQLIFRVADYYGPHIFYSDYTYLVEVGNSSTGMDENPAGISSKSIISTCDVLGREVDENASGLIIRKYNDGTARKFYIVR